MVGTLRAFDQMRPRPPVAVSARTGKGSSVDTAKELLVHELSDMMSAENIIVKMLPELAREAQTPEAKAAFKEHETETRGQIDRLKKAFDLLGEKAEKSTCYATEGLKKEHEALHEEKPSAEVLDLANLLGAAKTEHYEIASYAGLAQLATNLGEKEVAALLKETLAEEEAMAKRVTDLAKSAGKATAAATE
jgi:ferritin-like metal-binding protein YciE